MRIPVVKVLQPIGRFYLAALTPADIRLFLGEEGPCHPAPGARRGLTGAYARLVREAKARGRDPDGILTAPVVVALDSRKCTLTGGDFLEANPATPPGALVDGRHTVEALSDGWTSRTVELPVIFIFLAQGQTDYVSSKITRSRRRVARSPESIAHKMARLLNSDPVSPLYLRLPITVGGEIEAPSQATVAESIIPLITTDADDDRKHLARGLRLDESEPSGGARVPLRHYFVAGQDHVLYKVLLNAFMALAKVFPPDDNHYLPACRALWTRTGLRGVLAALPEICWAGRLSRELTVHFFEDYFDCFRRVVERCGLMDELSAVAESAESLAALLQTCFRSLRTRDADGEAGRATQPDDAATLMDGLASAFREAADLAAATRADARKSLKAIRLRFKADRPRLKA